MGHELPVVPQMVEYSSPRQKGKARSRDSMSSACAFFRDPLRHRDDIPEGFYLLLYFPRQEVHLISIPFKSYNLIMFLGGCWLFHKVHH